MKKIISLITFLLVCVSSIAQKDSLVKPPSIGLHFFYNDFLTPYNIKTNNLGYVLQNNLWNKPFKMQGGFGIDYTQGINKKIDLNGNLNTSWVDYQLPGNVLFGSDNLMLDFNAGANVKLLSDKHIFVPYIIAKAGFSKYKTLKGINLIPGLGLQINAFKEAFINTTFEYRAPLGTSLSPQLYYSIGLSTSISRKKTAKPEVPKTPEPAKVKKPEKVAEIVKPIIKNIAVSLIDEATGQPLEYAEVKLISTSGDIYTETTNEDGKAIFKDIPIGDYEVSGRLNKIDATKENLTKNSFASKGNQLEVKLSHNDPRFTLVGVTIDKSLNKPVGGTVVTVSNETQKSAEFVTSRGSDGEFRAQLESGSDFSVVGKKASYISNIEHLSTKGLNRSATLYVKLQLGIEEAKAGKSIVLNKIFFETGKSNLNTATSDDLQKLIVFLKDNPETKLEIQGHTDNVGSLATNQKLSQNRASSVVNYLVSYGISRARLIAVGYGPDRPIASNSTTEGKALNRRVEMKVIE
ncbi:OmpA family protein [Lacihabitans sp. LS3-19]|uniref:OmpA family protein n=1 Tax=Lacihabitans sp. LS3-19 TaxID=2487335 RepID=UPI0020CD239B|nr:OmpA family protein [Lacihabitans sp. LS3-19]